jgi:hypothetical protein
VAYVVSLNRYRRHMTPSQLAMAADKARAFYDEQAKERQKTRKGNQPGATVEDLPHLTEGKSRDAAGKALGVSGKMVMVGGSPLSPIPACTLAGETGAPGPDGRRV